MASTDHPTPGQPVPRPARPGPSPRPAAALQLIRGRWIASCPRCGCELAAGWCQDRIERKATRRSCPVRLGARVIDPVVGTHTGLVAAITEDSDPMRQHWPDQPEDEYERPAVVGVGGMVLAGAAIVGLVGLLWRRLRRR